MELNETELQDLDMLMEKIEKGEYFYALEVSKAKYLLGRIRELKEDKTQPIRVIKDKRSASIIRRSKR